MRFDHNKKLEVCEISSQSWKTHHRPERHNHPPASARSSASARNRNTVKIENRYRYTSREFVETNLYYYRARHMRPDLGRFISMDPLKTIDGTNMFGYVGNDPVWWSDPIGLYIYNNTNADPNDPTGGYPVPLPPAGPPSGWGNWIPPGSCPPFDPNDWPDCESCIEHCMNWDGGNGFGDAADKFTYIGGLGWFCKIGPVATGGTIGSVICSYFDYMDKRKCRQMCSSKCN